MSLSFHERIVAWQLEHGRHHLPWQAPTCQAAGDDQDQVAYKVWLSEVMLQQTQVATVLGYFGRFLAQFPTIRALAEANESEVLALWAGLGYYARGRRLAQCAREIVARHAGKFPATIEALQALPGIGRSTAGAIVSLAFDDPAAILDGNVKRVLARHAGITGSPQATAVAKQLWVTAESRLPPQHGRAYTQGLMDLGATVCLPRTPDCARCPVRQDCYAFQHQKIAEIPGRPVRKVLPVRHWYVLIVRSQGQVLLSRRPTTGIWPGLYAPLMLEQGVELERLDLVRSAQDALWKQGVSLHGDHWVEREPISHTLTHMKLWLHPIEWLGDDVVPLAMDSACDQASPHRYASVGADMACSWHDQLSCDRLAVPTPIKALLRKVWEVSSPDH